MGPATERPVLPGRGVGLHQNGFLGDRLDIGLFAGRVPVGVAYRHAEPSGQGRH